MSGSTGTRRCGHRTFVLPPLALAFLCASAASAALPIAPAGAATQAGAGAAILIAATIIGVLAQRLGRKICTNCKEFYEVPAVELRRLRFQ